MQLTRRHELIPRLVEIVKGYAGYERALLDESCRAAQRRARRAHRPRRAQRSRALREQRREAAGGAGRGAIRTSRPARTSVDLHAQARRHGEPDPVRAPLLQRRGEPVQQPHPALSGPADRQHLRLQARGVLRSGRARSGGGAGWRCHERTRCTCASSGAHARLAGLRWRAHRSAAPTSASSPSTAPSPCRRDGSLDVHEIIRVRAEGRQHPARHLSRLPHGLSRHATAGRSSSGSTSTPPSATGSRNTGAPSNAATACASISGSANVMLAPGEHIYELDYRTDRQLGFFADHDELYWNVTGNGWDFPDRRSARARGAARGHSGERARNSRLTRARRARKARRTRLGLLNGTPTFDTTTRPRSTRRPDHRRDVAEGLRHAAGRVERLRTSEFPREPRRLLRLASPTHAR